MNTFQQYGVKVLGEEGMNLFDSFESARRFVEDGLVVAPWKYEIYFVLSSVPTEENPVAEIVTTELFATIRTLRELKALS